MLPTRFANIILFGAAKKRSINSMLNQIMHIVSIIKNSSFINEEIVAELVICVSVVTMGGLLLLILFKLDRLDLTSGNVSTQNKTIDIDMIITDMTATKRACIDECGYSNRSQIDRFSLFLGKFRSQTVRSRSMK
jgi:hypothetical protein